MGSRAGRVQEVGYRKSRGGPSIVDNCSKFFKSTPGILKNEEGKGLKSHPIVRVVGMVLILSALVSLVSWGSSPTIPGARASTLQPPHPLDVGPNRSRQNAGVHALPQQYVAHTPIVIEGNADFAALGFPGEGSPSNPYVIEGLNITSATKNLIHIEETTAYFSIRNNLLNGLTGEHDGIYLKHVTHGTIDSNIVTNCGAYGIALKYSGESIDNNTVSNCEVVGIFLWDSEVRSVAYNTISNCGETGIRLWHSEVRSVAHNTISNCGEAGILLRDLGINTLVGNRLVNNGLVVGTSSNLGTVAENLVNDRPLVYWENVRGGTVPPGAGQVILINTTGVEVTGQNLSQASTGLYAALSSNLNIHHNTLSGVHLLWSENNTIAHNTVSQSTWNGIYLMNSKGNIVSHNTVSQNSDGIFLRGSEQNIVANNTVSQNSNGIELFGSAQNTVAHNTVSECGVGIRVESEGIDPLDAGQHTVTYNAVAECEVGIQLKYSDQNIMSHNTVSNCRKGIYLYETRQNTLVGNQLFNNGLLILGSQIENYVQATVAENMVNGRPLVFWQNVHGGTVPPGAGQVILINTTGVEVTGQNLSRASTGLYAALSSNLNIHHNTLSGVHFKWSENNTVAHNTVSQSTWGGGIYLVESKGDIVAHNTIAQCGEAGIKLDRADQNTLLNNTVSQCGEGIVLTATSGQNTLVGNQLVDNGLVIINLYSSDRFGDHIRPIEGYFQATVAENTVNGRPLVFWQNVRGGSIPPGAGQVILLTCTGIEVTGGDLSRVSTGVFAAGCSHLAIHHNTVSNNSQYGIHVHVSRSSTIAHNTISECGVGIRLYDSENTTLAHNTVIQNSRTGIYLQGNCCPSASKKNTLVYNTVANNTYGMYLCFSKQNIVSNNTVTHNTGFGISLSGYSEDNTVSHNTVTQNTGTGIRINSGKDNTISHNTLFNNSGSGIDLSYTKKNTVVHNSVANCGEAGIRLKDTEQITVAHNTISHNRGYGIGFEGSKNTTVIHNSVVNNTEYGIALSYFESISSRYDSEYNTVKGNDFLSNHPGGHSQASDEGSDNVFTRNYWADHDNTDRNGDWIADAPYPIDGGASNQDLSPLTVLVDLSHNLSTPIIAYPYGGETLQSTVTLQWAATIDTWEHYITYTVSYSADDGFTWIPLASGLSTSEYEWDTTTVADGSAYRVQVVATCSEGLTAEDRSDAPFTIQNSVTTITGEAFSIPRIPVAMLLVTLLLLLATHIVRRGKR